MSMSSSSPRSWPAHFAAAAALATLAASGAAMAAECRSVNGHFSEQSLAGPACLSPVGVCTQGTYSGALRGDFSTVVSSFTASADTPVTAAALFTADSTLVVRYGQRDGQLFIKNAGALRTTGNGEIVDLQVVVGGSGGFAGASGVLQASGAFTFAAGGRSEYVGVICLP